MKHEWDEGRVTRLENLVEKIRGCMTALKTEVAVLKHGGQSNRLLVITLITMLGNILVTILTALLK